MIRPHPSIPHVYQLSRDGSFSAPHVGVIGALHGNEPAGLRAIESIRKDPEAMAARLQRGTLELIHGNPLASEQHRRYSLGGTDINRLFSYSFEEELAKEAWTYEHRRAVELKPLITGLDAMVDLHSASRPTVPFAICDGTEKGIALAKKTGCRVTYGWDGPGMLMEHVSIGALVAAGRPAISVECGQHDEGSTVSTALTVLTRFLGALGITDHDPADSNVPIFELFARVVKPTHGFALSGEYESFQRLAAGEVLGRGDGVSITVERDAFLLLPTPSALRGEDIVYLAHAA